MDLYVSRSREQMEKATEQKIKKDKRLLDFTIERTKGRIIFCFGLCFLQCLVFFALIFQELLFLFPDPWTSTELSPLKVKTLSLRFFMVSRS